ncbi:MAG: apolipoprotein N-acyltransferase [Planctomycetota bacterium]
MLAKLRDWYGSTFGHAMVSAALLWAALPPADLWPLAWIAPIWWVLLVRRKELPKLEPPPHGQKSGSPRGWARLPIRLLRWSHYWAHRRPYRALWLAGFLFWMAALYWMRLPHWLTGFGWVASSCYLGFYLPAFIGLGRVAVHRLRCPVIVACPIAWTGLELARGHLLTGFTMASLGHTQYRWIELIQLSDLAGAYGVGFVVMFVAACLARMVPTSGRSWAFWPLLPAAAVLGGALVYGHLRLGGTGVSPVPQLGHGQDARGTRHGNMGRAPGEQRVRVALIQGSIDVVLNPEPGTRERMHQQYRELSQGAVAQYGDLDLIVWPETVFGGFLFDYDPDVPVPDEWNGSEARFRQRLREVHAESHKPLRDLAEELNTPLLVGVSTQFVDSEGDKCFNSAAFVPLSGDPIGRYDKMHLVLFGEYVPFAEELSWLVRLTPLSTLNIGVDPGMEPAVFELDLDRATPRASIEDSRFGVQGSAFRVQDSSADVEPEVLNPEPRTLNPRLLRIAPNICYESVIPHLIRRQVNTLAQRGQEPDVLVNLTNDGWFWGSSELDMHLACGVFRAVECRKPFLIAANTGFSAWIDADGRIVAQGPRRATGTVLALVAADPRSSWYLAHGDWPAGVCLAACLVLAAVGIGDRFAKRVHTSPKRKRGNRGP